MASPKVEGAHIKMEEVQKRTTATYLEATKVLCAISIVTFKHQVTKFHDTPNTLHLFFLKHPPASYPPPLTNLLDEQSPTATY